MKARIWLVVFLVSTVAVLAACNRKGKDVKTDSLRNAYDVEQDWSDPQHLIPLNYQQAQGKRLFYQNCVWCHADSTPAGPSNRTNLTPAPALMNDGATLNGLSDNFLQNMTTLGGSALGKSAMMPAWGRTLSPEEIRAIIAYARAMAQPPYQPPARPGPQYSAR